MTTETSTLIKSIYIYLFTAIGLGMFLVGSYNLIQFATKKLALPKYYLDYQESRCDYIAQPVPVTADGATKPIDPAAQSMEEQKNQCLQRLEEDRANQQVIQLSSSLTLILLGGATFWFHYRKTGLSRKEGAEK
jgi:hypothetical protein